MSKQVLTGYDYHIVISQIGANNANLKDKVDLIDLAIFEMLLKYKDYSGCKKMQSDEKTYYFFHWSLIKTRIPFSGINSRSGAKRRFKTLCECGLLEAHPDNQTLGQSWFATGYVYDMYANFGEPVHEKVTPSTKKSPRPQQDTPPSTKMDTPPSTVVDTPVHENGHNDSTYNDITYKDDNTYKQTQGDTGANTPDVVNQKKPETKSDKKDPSPDCAPPPSLEADEITEIIEHLNDVCNRKFEPSTKVYRMAIKARMKEGNDKQTCFDVIETMAFCWKHNDQMKQHLNPETLFRAGKFPKYKEMMLQAKENPELFKLTHNGKQKSNNGHNLDGNKTALARMFFG